MSMVLVACLLIAAGCGGTTPAPATPNAPASTPAGTSAAPATPAAAASVVATTEFVADIDVGGRTMRLTCAGPLDTGGPTVILEPGFGTPSYLWSDVIDGLHDSHRVCAYDRAGMGQSQPAIETSRTTADLVDDLRAMLDGAGVDGPLVMVGHSLGAWVVAVFAERYPEDVVGLVFADPRGPRVSEGWRAALPDLAASEPESVATIRYQLGSLETDPLLNRESLVITASAAEVAAALDAPGPLFGDLPVIVLQAASTPESLLADLPADLAAALEAVWLSGHQELADESTAGSVVVVPDAGHDFAWEQPEVVIEVVETLLADLAAR
jgi:pimeloyl-ACP methyl ester carboxylesterase